MAVVVRLRNVYQEPLNDRGDVDLFDMKAKNTVARRRNVKLGSSLRFDVTGARPYRITVFPQKHRPVSKPILVPGSGNASESIVFPMHPDRVLTADFPSFAELPQWLRDLLERSTLEGHADLSGQALYDGIGDVPRAGLLNVVAKMEDTMLPGGSPA